MFSVRKYKYSIALYLAILFAFIIIIGFGIFSETIFFISRLNPWFFIYMPIIMYLGTFSFALPFSFLSKKGTSIWVVFKGCLMWTYLNIIGEDGNLYTQKLLGFSLTPKKNFATLRFMDFFAIISVMTFSFLFIPFNKWFLFLYLFVLFFSVLFLILEWKNFPSKNFFALYVLNVLKYPIEALVPFFILYSFGFNFSFPLILFFTSTSCVLYYFPKFKLAGGLVSLFFIYFFFAMGLNPFFGFLVATTLRLSSVFFFIIPIFFWRKYV